MTPHAFRANTIAFALSALIVSLVVYGCNTNASPPVKEQPKIVLPEEWPTISHDSTHPTPLNAWIDSKGIIQTEFQ